jgi:hypothetical protein
VLGGLFFARRMRECAFTTLIDPFEARFGRHWAAVLFIPALMAEVFWSAELLVAIGSTFGVMLRMPLVTAILLSAVVVTLYTMAGGMWSVAYTDAIQLTLVVIGLAWRCRTRSTRPAGSRRVVGVRVVGARTRRAAAHAADRDVCLDARCRRALVGRQRDARVRRHPLELLLPARALVPDAAPRAAPLGVRGRDDDRA